MTDICTLNLRQANHQLLGDDALRERVMNCQLGRGAGHGSQRDREPRRTLSLPRVCVVGRRRPSQTAGALR